MRFITFVLVSLLASGLASGSAVAEVREVQVFYGLKFVPERISINPGDTVRWVWISGGGHNVVSGRRGKHNGFFRSGEEMDDGTFEVKFTKRFLRKNISKNGVYHYYCEPHWNEGMVGRVTIKSPPK